MKRKVITTIEDYLVMTFATVLLVIGVYIFKFPNHFSFGGVTGIAVVLTAVLPVSATMLTNVINIALLVLGFAVLGRGFGIRTVLRLSCLRSARRSCLIWMPPAAVRISLR